MSTVSLPTHSRSRYYLAIAAFMSLLVLVGFWPTYFSQVFAGHLPQRHWVVHLHGWIYVGWMFLFVTQVVLAATGRVRAHLSLGRVGIAYGFLVLVMGLIVSVVQGVVHFHAGEQSLDEAGGFLIIPLGDMVLFGGFFLPAVLYRRRPDVHKRLMLFATTALLFATVGRLAQFITVPVSIALWFLPVLIGIAYDKWSRGRVHPAYFIGFGAMTIAFSRVALEQSEIWLPIGRAIIQFFA